MVQGAHYILGPFGQDSDLRRWGLKLCQRGGSKAKKRAVVAVARKLSMLLHKLWVSGEVYEPLRNQRAMESAVVQVTAAKSWPNSDRTTSKGNDKTDLTRTGLLREGVGNCRLP
jgi:hypothetical protein